MTELRARSPYFTTKAKESPRITSKRLSGTQKLRSKSGVGGGQDKIGDFYLEGNGVPQSYVKAHMWYNIYAANGGWDGARKRDNVAEKMTSDQIAEAQRMASEMLEANPKLLGE